MDLDINKTKITYMRVTRQDPRGRMKDRVGQNISKGEFNFGRIKFLNIWALH